MMMGMVMRKKGKRMKAKFRKITKAQKDKITVYHELSPELLRLK